MRTDDWGDGLCANMSGWPSATRFDSVEFVKAVNAHLTAIREAENRREWAREAGRFGGFLRSMRSVY